MNSTTTTFRHSMWPRFSSALGVLGFVLVFFVLPSCGPKKTELEQLNLTTGEASKPSFLSSWAPGDQATSTVGIKVIDLAGRPVANADVLIGSARGVPFQNNFLKTDSKGEIKVSSRDWTTPLHVTVDAAGFTRQTLLSQKPGQMVIKLNVAQLINQAKITGVVNGLPIVNGDKFVDFGLIMSSLTKADLFNFDLGTVMSPYSDTMTALGQSFAVPSNTSIPNQKEKYIFNITLDKPLYTYYVPQYGKKQLFSAAGKFEFKPAVDELRDGKPFYELVNYFNLSGGSIREIDVQSSTTTLNFPAQEINFAKKVTSKSPTISAEEVFLSLALNEVAGQFVPSSIRQMNSNETAELAVIGSAPVHLVHALKRKAEFMTDVPGNDRISVSFLPFKEGDVASMLPLIEGPQVSFRDFFSVTTPQFNKPSRMTELAFSGALADVYQKTNDGQTVTTLVRRWEIFGTGWPQQVQLPKWPLTKESGAVRQRFELNLIGGLNAPKLELGDDLVDAVTHVTRSSTDL